MEGDEGAWERRVELDVEGGGVGVECEGCGGGIAACSDGGEGEGVTDREGVVGGGEDGGVPDCKTSWVAWFILYQ